MNAPKVAVIVLNYNGVKWLRDCLSSVVQTEYPGLDVYLVDNGSTDGSVNYVRRAFPWVKIISNKTNLGFSEGYNRAVGKVESEYVLLLNNDTQILTPNWVNLLVEVARGETNVAAVGCKMVSMEDHSLLDSVGGMGIPFWRGFVDIGRGERDVRQYNFGFEPFAFCGGAALLKRDLFVKAGGFDGKFFMYLEDVDLSWRLRLLGYRICFAHEVKVAHYSSGSAGSKSVDARKLYYCHRNLLRSILKNCGSSLGWALRNYLLFSLITILGFYIYEPVKAHAVSRAIMWNLLNFRDTYIRRLSIQASRLENEAGILAKMYPRLGRYQPAEHIRLRHILNILFEYDQRSRIRQ